MSGPSRSSHGSTVRGLTLSRGSDFSFGGQFGRMFYQDPLWMPGKANAQGRFGLREFIKAALS